MKNRDGSSPLRRCNGPRVLMLGYNGANNTGAEALLQADIDDVRAVLGPRARITVPAINPANLRRYLAESPTLRIVKVPTLFFGPVRRLVKESDVVLLVEGSTYMDTWGSPLLWLYLWATHCAWRMRKPCMAYAVDAGSLRPGNRRRVRRTASRTDMIVARTRSAALRLHRIGVTAPLAWTADNAFTYRPRPEDEGWPFGDWPEAWNGIAGISVVDFTLWPAVMRPFGARDRCYKWPYYFSRSRGRLQFRQALVRGYAAQADRIVQETGKAVALIAMEQVDEPVLASVRDLMVHKERARIVSSREYDSSRMTALLRSLDLLITSRFHAAVLSLPAGVPQVAVGHDTRLRTLYADLGMAEWWMDPLPAGGTESGAPTAGLFDRLQEKVSQLLADPGQQAEALRTGYAQHLARARSNRAFLEEFARRSLGHAPDQPEAKAGEPACRADECAQGGATWVA